MLQMLIGGFCMYVMFKDKNAEVIRRSYLWPFACLLWCILSIITITGMFEVIGQLGIKLPPDEQAVPILFGICMLAILVVGYINIWRPHRRMKKRNAVLIDETIGMSNTEV
jgi:Na+/proline symporter